MKKPLALIIPLLSLIAAPNTSAEDNKLGNVPAEEARFYALGRSAKEAFNKGDFKKAESEAQELQKLASKFTKNWNYGNAIQNYNIVLGRLAVRNGDIKLAKKYLLAAGKTEGSPQLGSFGPNMSLAKDLLDKGESKVVLEYLELCRVFWKENAGKLDEWKRAIEGGKIPDFGANLNY